jgi:hypothetical protein
MPLPTMFVIVPGKKMTTSMTWSDDFHHFSGDGPALLESLVLSTYSQSCDYTAARQPAATSAGFRRPAARSRR